MPVNQSILPFPAKTQYTKFVTITKHPPAKRRENKNRNNVRISCGVRVPELVKTSLGADNNLSTIRTNEQSENHSLLTNN